MDKMMKRSSIRIYYSVSHNVYDNTIVIIDNISGIYVIVKIPGVYR